MTQVVQIYMSWTNSSVAVPKIQLVGVQRTLINAGTSKQVTFIIMSQQMAVWSVGKHAFVVQPGNNASVIVNGPAK